MPKKRKKKKNYNWLWWTAGTVIVIGVPVTIYAVNQKSLLEKTQYKFIGGRVHKLLLENINYDIKIRLLNVSDLDIKIKNYDLYFYMLGAMVARVAGKSTQLVRSNNFSDLVFNINFNPKQIFSLAWNNLQNVLFHREQIPIKTTGFITVTVNNLITKKIPIDFSSTLKELAG